MPFVSRRLRVRLLTLIMACIVALTVSGLDNGLGTMHPPVAHAAPQACGRYIMDNGHYGFCDADYWTTGDPGCLGVPQTGPARCTPVVV